MSRLATYAATARRATRSPRLGRLLSRLLLLVIVASLVLLARRIEWAQVWKALTDYRLGTLLLATVPMVLSYAVYSTFDLIGRRYTHHQLAARRVMTIGFVSYAFNQSLTAWVGGIAARYRLYARHGLRKGVIAQIFAISVLTNWIGYLTLAAVLLMAGAVPVPADWPLDGGALRVLGVLLLILPLAYLYCCYRYTGRTLTLFRYHWRALGPRTAALQIGLGMVNWALMALVIYILLQQQVAYPVVLSVLLLSAVSAVILHIPAGLGVIEGVFIALLHGQVDRSSVMAAMVAYRAIYYLLPLAPAAVIYFVLEARGKRQQPAVSNAANS